VGQNLANHFLSKKVMNHTRLNFRFKGFNPSKE